MVIGQMEEHQHMSQHVLLMLISTLNTYACFVKKTIFHNATESSIGRKYFHDIL
jgi:hypothetical protein